MKRILYLGLDPTHCPSKGLITHFPIIKISPVPFTDSVLANALNDFILYSHVIITSKSTVKILLDYSQKFPHLLEEWTNKKTIAIGQVTAQHLLKAGIFPYVIAKEETAEGLLKEINPHMSSNNYYFWPHSADSRPIISDFFNKQNCRFRECVLYHTKTNYDFKNDNILPNLDDFDEIVFTSPTTVKSFLELFKELPRQKILTPIGPITSNYLQKHL